MIDGRSLKLKRVDDEPKPEKLFTCKSLRFLNFYELSMFSLHISLRRKDSLIAQQKHLAQSWNIKVEIKDKFYDSWKYFVYSIGLTFTLSLHTIFSAKKLSKELFFVISKQIDEIHN